MAAKRTTSPAEKPARKPRTPKPVTDLPSATTALAAAKRKADRTAKARAGAVAADALAQTELEQAKAVVKRFYAEVMGEDVDEDAAPADSADDTDPLYHGGYGDDETATDNA